MISKISDRDFEETGFQLPVKIVYRVILTASSCDKAVPNLCQTHPGFACSDIPNMIQKSVFAPTLVSTARHSTARQLVGRICIWERTFYPERALLLRTLYADVAFIT